MYQITDYLSPRRQPPAYQAWTLEHTRSRAVRYALVRVTGLCDWAEPIIDEARALEHRFRVSQLPPVDPATVVATDRACDALCGVISSSILQLAGRPSQTLAGEAHALHQLLFPRGLKGHIAVPFITQVELNADLLKQLADPRFVPVISYLHLQEEIDQLSAAQDRFRAMVLPRVVVPWEDVVAAADRGWQALLRVLHAVTAELNPFDAKEAAIAWEVLGPQRAADTKVHREIMASRRKSAAEAACKDPAQKKDDAAQKKDSAAEKKDDAAKKSATANSSEDAHEDMSAGDSSDSASVAELPELDNLARDLATQG
jgi:hypothetical protein